MNKTTTTNGFLWVAIFATLFFLTQDYFFVSWSVNTGFLGLPIWLWWFVGIHFIFIFVFFIFTKKYWQE